jgi:hypothetical protein
MQMSDPYAGINNPGFPPRRAVAVSPSDTTDLTDVARLLYVGGTGNLVLLLAGDGEGSEVTLTAVPAGAFIPLQVQRVLNTGTTASDIVAFYD